MKMVVDGKKARYGQLYSIDRLSDLPDSIIHHIISYLDTEEACRTTILSKRWARIWSTGLILDFRSQFFVTKKKGRSHKKTVLRLMNSVETTMRQYSEKNLSIRKFRVEYLTAHQGMAGRIDGCLGIALQNQVEELSLSFIHKRSPYGLPASLFLSKSLTSMKLSRVKVPYYENLKLVSLQSLDLSEVVVDKHMLHDIIKSCPLKILDLDRCSGLQNISIPFCSGLESLSVGRTVPAGGTILVYTSSFQRCIYSDGEKVDPFPIILTPASKKNLRVLQISHVCIVDDIFDKLMSELPSIENMEFLFCTMPKNVKIASQTLKELVIRHCFKLINLAIEAPNLDTFRYNGHLQLLWVINSHNKYNAYLHLSIFNLGTRALVGIKNLLSKSNCCCKVLCISLSANDEQIEFDKDLLNTIDDGSPCDIQELKLSVKSFDSNFGESSCEALVDGLLWCCRPDILSLSIILESQNIIIKVCSFSLMPTFFILLQLFCRGQLLSFGFGTMTKERGGDQLPGVRWNKLSVNDQIARQIHS
ncbi:uncharacterized protein LOC141606662 [Silene latifolia]|uniref:uncharacterized protein LOC141606662 n=1 Tax=Silene latifolia TaxID=37657 RepID=UPI003D7837E3